MEFKWTQTDFRGNAHNKNAQNICIKWILNVWKLKKFQWKYVHSFIVDELFFFQSMPIFMKSIQCELPRLCSKA